MNNCGICSQSDIHRWTGKVTFSKLLVSYLITYISNIILKFSSHDALILVVTLQLNKHL
jgi:hypothetical protein